MSNTTCSECGTSLRPDTKFCSECGTKVVPAKAALSASSGVVIEAVDDHVTSHERSPSLGEVTVGIQPASRTSAPSIAQLITICLASWLTLVEPLLEVRRGFNEAQAVSGAGHGATSEPANWIMAVYIPLLVGLIFLAINSTAALIKRHYGEAVLTQAQRLKILIPTAIVGGGFSVFNYYSLPTHVAGRDDRSKIISYLVGFPLGEAASDLVHLRIAGFLAHLGQSMYWLGPAILVVTWFFMAKRMTD